MKYLVVVNYDHEFSSGKVTETLQEAGLILYDALDIDNYEEAIEELGHEPITDEDKLWLVGWAYENPQEDYDYRGYISELGSDDFFYKKVDLNQEFCSPSTPKVTMPSTDRLVDSIEEFFGGEFILNGVKSGELKSPTQVTSKEITKSKNFVIGRGAVGIDKSGLEVKGKVTSISKYTVTVQTEKGKFVSLDIGNTFALE